MPDPVLPSNYADDFRSVVAVASNRYRDHLPVRTHRRCYVTHSGIGVRRMIPMRDTLFEHLPRPMSRHLHLYAWYKYLRERRVRSASPNLLLLHNHWSGGYHHWLTEALVKLQFAPPETHTVIMPEDYPRFAHESLVLLGVKRTLKVPPLYGVRAERLTVVANPYSGHYHPQHLDWLRERLVPHGDPDVTPASRLYISRSREKMRKIENEDQVIEVLKRRGFTIIDAGGLSFRQQIALFSRCEVLVSIHGAGLTNCLFMPRGAKLLELYRELTPEHPRMNACYWRQSTTLGLQYYYQFCAHGQNLGPDIDRTNIRVDIPKLEDTVSRMLA
jgi:capsular polysaccharide biosynthesis protein